MKALFLLTLMSVAGCATRTLSGPEPCVASHQESISGYRTRRFSSEYYTLAGQRVSRSELEQRLIENPQTHRDVVLARNLRWTGVALVVTELATALAGTIMLAGSDATGKMSGEAVLIPSMVSLVPTLAGFLGGSSAAFRGAVDHYNTDPNVTATCRR